MTFKIYFAGRIQGRDDADAAIYKSMVALLKTYGTVLTEHVSHDDPTMLEESNNMDKKGNHDLDIYWLQESDVLVAEVTQPSLGVGYEIGRAVAMGKNILCLFRPSSGKPDTSAMIQGAHNGSSFIVKHYAESEAKSVIKEYMDALKQ